MLASLVSVVVVGALNQPGEGLGLEDKIEIGAEVGLAACAERGGFEPRHGLDPAFEAPGIGQTGFELRAAIGG